MAVLLNQWVAQHFKTLQFSYGLLQYDYVAIIQQCKKHGTMRAMCCVALMI